MIDIRLSTQNTLPSRIIRDFTRGAYSHVDVLLSGGQTIGSYEEKVTAGGVVIPSGVQLRPMAYADFAKTKILTFDTGDDKAFLDFMHAQIGKPYDWPGIAGIALDRNWHNSDAWFCSEIVAAALEAGHFIHPLDTSFYFVSPRDIDLIGCAVGA